jgi:hypothetical protein
MVKYKIIDVGDFKRRRETAVATLNYQLILFQSKLEVIERQSDRGLSGSIVKLEVGVASMHAMEARLKLGGQATVYLDTPKGLLVAWSVEGPKHQAHIPHPHRSHSIAPFHQKSHLLKTVN